MKTPAKTAKTAKPRKHKPGLAKLSAPSTLPAVLPPGTPAPTKLGRPRKVLPPNAGKGRGKGASNIMTRVIKEAVLDAAAAEGADGTGRDGLVGYLRRLARHEPRSFSSLLGRIIPVQIGSDPDHPLTIIISAEDARIG